jgi:hypothetical protein
MFAAGSILLQVFVKIINPHGPDPRFLPLLVVTHSQPTDILCRKVLPVPDEIWVADVSFASTGRGSFI